MENALKEIKEKIAEAAHRSGRHAEDVTLLAVSKMHPPETILEASKLGLMLFGESRVQDAKEKIPALPTTLRWHFIGHLQRNKIRQALPLFECFQSVDNVKLAGDMNRIADELDLTPSVLLEVNVSGETTKYGFSAEGLREAMDNLLSLQRLKIGGLMTLAPYSDNPETARPVFAALRELRNSLCAEFSIDLPVLSMGMSGDFEVGIEEGSTLVRVGTAIFGSRNQKG